MAARTIRTFNHEAIRATIKTNLLLKAMSDHVLNQKKLKMSQITAAIALLRKVLPDLTAVDVQGETTTVHILKREPMTVQELAAKHDIELPPELQIEHKPLTNGH